jgi:Uma2 family endonuclease
MGEAGDRFLPGDEVTMTTVSRQHSDVMVMRRIPYKTYATISGIWENRHLRMAYHDGTLEIVSPILFEHENSAIRLRRVVTTVAEHLGLAYQGAGGTTYRRSGEGVYKGKGKQPDESFYIPSVFRLPRDRNIELDAGDPPPDLWIEVDNRISSAGRLPVYAALGVPEVWRYRARRKTLQFLRLVGDSYEPIERSLALPPLTPALVREALALGGDLIESDWVRLLREWVARTIEPPA